NGYGTSWFGKDHNTPDFQASQVGPFDQWPTGMGFDYFYGFVGGDTSQWQPNLFRNTTPIQPYVGKPGWNLTTPHAGEAIHWLKQPHETAPDKPFFCYYVPGGTHAPHHPTPEWIDRISKMHLFDKGWNALREQIFANQKKNRLAARAANRFAGQSMLFPQRGGTSEHGFPTSRPNERRRMMKRLNLAALGVALLVTPTAWTEQPMSPEEAALLKRAEAFVETFNKGDAKALSEFFTPDADVVDPEGHHIKGRKAIEETYRQYFAGAKGAKLFVHITSVRVVRSDLALEDALTE